MYWIQIHLNFAFYHPCNRALICIECDLLVILRQGCEVSVKELDSLMSLLVEKRRKMEQEEAETNMQILLDFLHCLRKQKLEELNEVLELELISFQQLHFSSFKLRIGSLPSGSGSIFL